MIENMRQPNQQERHAVKQETFNAVPALLA